MKLYLHSIDELISIREKARENNDWAFSDEIRDYLDSKNVIIMDSKDGQIVYNELEGTTREDVVKRIADDRRAEATFEAWLYTMQQSPESKKSRLEHEKSIEENRIKRTEKEVEKYKTNLEEINTKLDKLNDVKG